MIEKMNIQKIIVVILFGFIGQLGCWALMIGGQAITTIDNALIIHAIGAPIIFATLSVIFFKKLRYTTPLIAAITFLAVVILLDFFVVALFINQSFDMFLSPIGTWIPFALIFTSTYLTGNYVTVRAQK